MPGFDLTISNFLFAVVASLCFSFYLFDLPFPFFKGLQLNVSLLSSLFGAGPDDVTSWCRLLSFTPAGFEAMHRRAWWLPPRSLDSTLSLVCMLQDGVHFSFHSASHTEEPYSVWGAFKASGLFFEHQSCEKVLFPSADERKTTERIYLFMHLCSACIFISNLLIFWSIRDFFFFFLFMSQSPAKKVEIKED